MDDEDYLIKHQIPHLIEALLVDLIKDKPTDIVGYFIDWLGAKKGRKFFVGGNWKCNGTRSSIVDLCGRFNKGSPTDSQRVDVVVACPSLLLEHTRQHLRPDWAVAAQNCWKGPSGAFTGEVSAEMLRDAGAQWVILGHSERRHLPEIKETDEIVAAKVKTALQAGLHVVLCCGELLGEREAGRTAEVVERQCAAVAARLSEEEWERVVIAYGPVWAVGNGQSATPRQVQDVHQGLRSWLGRVASPTVAAATRIVYGGSVTDTNCADFATQPDVDGFLVGGASLTPEFLTIVDAYRYKHHADSPRLHP